jgi:hypothetical protein
MKIRNTDKKTRNFLAMIFCTLVIVSTIGSSFSTNSFAQQQQLQQAPTITYKSPWNNNMPISSVGSSQPLSNPSSTNSAQPTTQPQNTARISSSSTNNTQPTTQPQNTGSSSSTPTKSADPTKVSTNIKNTFTNSKNLSVNHAFVNSRIIGPDRFRFVTSYWTTSDVSRLIDAGRSAGNVTTADTGKSSYVAPGVTSIGPAFLPRAFLPGFGTTAATPFSGGLTSSGGGAFPLSNLQVEVDRGEGYATLAIVLQYEGVVSLAGITAGLKLPIGFQAQYPLTDDRRNFDIALANFDGGIRPSQEVVLYFPLYVTTHATPQLPVLGPLALHFLRSAPRSVGDSLSTTEGNMFAKVLTVTNGTNQTIFNNSLGLNTNYSDKSGRLIPFDFVNQVIPVIFQATGREVLDVYQSCGEQLTHTSCKIPNVITSPNPLNLSNKSKAVTAGFANATEITLANHGDVPIYNLVVQFNTVLPVLSSTGIVVAPQLPIVIQGPTTFYLNTLLPGHAYVITLYISSALDCNTNQALQVDSIYNNVLGIRTEQTQAVGIPTGGYLLCPSAPGAQGQGQLVSTVGPGFGPTYVEPLNATHPILPPKVLACLRSPHPAACLQNLRSNH